MIRTGGGGGTKTTEGVRPLAEQVTVMKMECFGTTITMRATLNELNCDGCVLVLCVCVWGSLSPTLPPSPPPPIPGPHSLHPPVYYFRVRDLAQDGHQLEQNAVCTPLYADNALLAIRLLYKKKIYKKIVQRASSTYPKRQDSYCLP